jgi:Fic-DOC domain mobile mystery protein B
MIPDYPPGATPLDSAEMEGLIPSSIATQAELNEFEQANILEAQKWFLSARKKDLLSSAFLKELHRKMFGYTWRWAGMYRKTEKNIGCSWPHISRHLEALCDEAKYWVREKSFSPDEIAIRFHHRLVSIHCFSNGNGRHSRLAADCLVKSLGKSKFSWGSGDLYQPGEQRKKYIEALQKADQGDVEPLLRFARS